MHAQKVAGKQGPGWSGEMDAMTKATAGTANALFIFPLSQCQRLKVAARGKPYAHLQLVVRLADFS
jgi:hypothetical protein